ncbi:MAG: DUF1853 family protein [Cryomorphaceae bacterium]
MFTPEEMGRLSALGLFQAESMLADSSIPNVEMFGFSIDPTFPPFEDALPEKAVIGKRAELFVKHYLTHQERYELIADGTQAIVDGQTLGEFDFFLKDNERGVSIHLEMACKWYLLDPETDDPPSWIGPNKRDTLSKKIEKLGAQQFPLLHEAKALPTLERIGVDPSSTIQCLAFPGFAFVPTAYDGPLDPIRKECLTGAWCRLDEFKSLQNEGARYYLPNRYEWLIDPMYNREWDILDSIVKRLEVSLSKKRSTLVWTLLPDGRTERTFVVWW